MYAPDYQRPSGCRIGLGGASWRSLSTPVSVLVSCCRVASDIHDSEIDGVRWTRAGAVHDASRWPLVKITLPATGSDAMWQAFLQRMEKTFDDEWRRQLGCVGSYCVLLDISAVTDNNAQRRRDWDQLLARHEHIIQRDCVGIAVVLQSVVARFIYTAVTWLEEARGGKKVPSAVFSTFADAHHWCEVKLREAGCSIGVD